MSLRRINKQLKIRYKKLQEELSDRLNSEEYVKHIERETKRVRDELRGIRKEEISKLKPKDREYFEKHFCWLEEDEREKRVMKVEEVREAIEIMNREFPDIFD